MHHYAITADDTIGGAIVFSPEINAVRLHQSYCKNLLLQRMLSTRNRLCIKRLIHHQIVQFNAVAQRKVNNYTILRQRGVYVSKQGEAYKECSVKLEILGADRELLTELAQALLERFHQQSVMVVLYREGVKFHVRSEVQ